MIRRDLAYWQRLRKDVPTNTAGVFAAISVLAATLCVIGTFVAGTHQQSRDNPLYWLLMLPAAWWVSGLTTFAPHYVRSWKPVIAACCLVSAGCAALSMQDGLQWTAQAIGLIVTVVAAAASLLLYSRSLVAREGPAR